MPPATNSTADVSAWLTTDFIASFERDVDPTIWTPIPYEGGFHERGFFAIAVLTLTYCDAMAGLITGCASSDGTEATVRFIETEVAPNAGDRAVSTRYVARAAALLQMYRHGPAHQREPGLLDWTGTQVAWCLMRGGPVARHLRLTRRAPWYHLHVDVDLLNAHVLATFKAIRERARRDPNLARRIYEGAVEASSPQTPRCGPAGYVGLKLTAMLQNPDT